MIFDREARTVTDDDDGVTRPFTDAENHAEDEQRALEAVLAARAGAEGLREEAVAIRDTLALLVQTPVAQRDPAEVAYVTAEGITLTMQTLDNPDSEIQRLRAECSALALAATQQRLAAVFGVS